QTLANDNAIAITPISGGFVDKGYDMGSSKVRALKARRIGLITGEGVGSNAAGEIWHFFDQQIDYPVTLINLNDLGRIRLSDYDVLIMPDGNYRFLNDKIQTDVFKNWIRSGGHVVALEGAVQQLAAQDFGLKEKKDDDDNKDSNDAYASLRKYEDRERDFIPNITPGSIFKVDLDNTHPLGFGYPNYYYTLKQDDKMYEFIKEGGWNVGVIKKSKQISGFVGSKLQKRLQDGLLFGVQDYGQGTITYLADNVLFRSFWENGKLMFANAVFLVGQ
ncbi:MAG: zinc carboxypeptidase, partial [Flavisolibacter sp.]